MTACGVDKGALRNSPFILIHLFAPHISKGLTAQQVGSGVRHSKYPFLSNLTFPNLNSLPKLQSYCHLTSPCMFSTEFILAPNTSRRHSKGALRALTSLPIQGLLPHSRVTPHLQAMSVLTLNSRLLLA